MSRFNLIEEPWISVIYEEGGKNKLVSLHTLFEDAHLIKRLAGDTKTQDFAVMRVLLAILQTVFSRLDANGDVYSYVELDARWKQVTEVDEDDGDEYLDALDETWENLWRSGVFNTVVNDYLDKWTDRFYLFDDEYPFFQVIAEDVSEDKLSRKNPTTLHGKFINRTISESGNKTALFSPKYEAADNKEILSADEVARWLITYHGYTGLSEKATFDVGKYKASKGWLYDLGGIYIEGQNLFETLVLNCVLIHPREEYVLNSQKPCWEYSSKQLLKEYFQTNNPDNLAQLYTTWSRAVYINPERDLNEAFSLGVVKLPDLNHQNQFLEPMTLWQFQAQGENKDTFTPRKHRAEQALWRSFGLIAMPSSDNLKQVRPGIIDWLDDKKELIGNTMIKVQGVSMKDDANATSWVPTDEIVDALNINDYVLTDVKENHWVPRIEGVVEKTQNVINRTFRGFLSDIADIRNIKETAKNGFLDRELSYMYFEIDRPFRQWLSSIEPYESKDEKVSVWLDTLYQLVRQRASHLLRNASSRDLRGIIKDERTFNIATAYNSFMYFLNKEIKK